MAMPKSLFLTLLYIYFFEFFHHFRWIGLFTNFFLTIMCGVFCANLLLVALAFSPTTQLLGSLILFFIIVCSLFEFHVVACI